MRVSHGYTSVFDDPNLVSCAGLAPVLQLAERAGLQALAADHVQIGRAGGARPELKIPSLVAGMIAGADVWIASEYVDSPGCTAAVFQAHGFNCGDGTRTALANWATRVSAVNLP